MSISCVTKALKNGKAITIYTLTNDANMSVEILNLGGIITKILVPDRDGKIENVVLEYKDLNTYSSNPGCFGAIIGRTAGRIYKGQVHIQDKFYQLQTNNKGNTLHGGIEGFHKKIWDASVSEDSSGTHLTLNYRSPDGEEGYPGAVNVEVTYTLTRGNELIVTYKGVTTKDTLLNLTNHTYFNLSGNAKRSILSQELYINSDKVLEVDENLIPTGAYLDVTEHTPFNFKQPKPIGRDIDANHIQLQYGCGYDHGWVLGEGDIAVSLQDNLSGRRMTIKTNQPGVIMFTQNFGGVGELITGGCGKRRYATCFETQNFPIGHNEIFKKQSLLKKGETYKQQTVFKFTTV